jgi:hypothetical protein
VCYGTSGPSGQHPCSELRCLSNLRRQPEASGRHSFFQYFNRALSSFPETKKPLLHKAGAFQRFLYYYSLGRMHNGPPRRYKKTAE